ncbi:hypothetical protein JB92DRAFT_3138590 [Gautieria morchelliformis]|nr:hypothetical protein JB92DRAFT_3138590 [Gautieria morchelliformis]
MTSGQIKGGGVGFELASAAQVSDTQPRWSHCTTTPPNEREDATHSNTHAMDSESEEDNDSDGLSGSEYENKSSCVHIASSSDSQDEEEDILPGHAKTMDSGDIDATNASNISSDNNDTPARKKKQEELYYPNSLATLSSTPRSYSVFFRVDPRVPGIMYIVHQLITHDAITDTPSFTNRLSSPDALSFLEMARDAEMARDKIIASVQVDITSMIDGWVAERQGIPLHENPPEQSPLSTNPSPLSPPSPLSAVASSAPATLSHLSPLL